MWADRGDDPLRQEAMTHMILFVLQTVLEKLRDADETEPQSLTAVAPGEN